ncbi:DUF2815 family protein [Senegalia sp. (in: firmicutes)]|uniref:DUF2815 family protein n=1 Tax=Senegalia sp. (in: firmicutes) TaxID=1924098 RepID=UPI003F966BDA
MTKIVTGKARLSYANLFTPKAGIAGGDEKYSVSLIIPKGDTATIQKIEKAIEKATKEGVSRYGTKFGKSANFRIPLRDGDIDKPDDAAYKKSYFLNVNSKTKPGVVDKDVNPILDPSEVYSGCYGRASIVAFPYSVNGSTGVSFALHNIQKLEDGEPLGGKARAEDDFSAFDDEDDLLG